MSRIFERWLPIEGLEPYEASSFGNIRNGKTRRMLKTEINRKKNGYLRVNICGKKRYVHKLVAETFFDCPEGCVIHHGDGNRLNNDLNNLIICGGNSESCGQI